METVEITKALNGYVVKHGGNVFVIKDLDGVHKFIEGAYGHRQISPEEYFKKLSTNDQRL